MGVNIKAGKQKSKPLIILIGIGVSLITSLAFAALIAYLVSTQTLGQAGIETLSLPVLLLSSAFGALVSAGSQKEKRAIVCLITVTGYYAVLVLGNVFLFGGEFRGFWISLIMVLLGGLAAMLPALHKKGGKAKYKIPPYR